MLEPRGKRRHRAPMAVHLLGTWLGLTTSLKTETLVPQHHVLMGTYLTAALLQGHQRLEKNLLHTSPFSSYVSVKFCLVLRFLKRNSKIKTLSHSEFSLMLLLTKQHFLKCKCTHIVWKSINEWLKITDSGTFSVFVCSLLFEQCIPRGGAKNIFSNSLNWHFPANILKSYCCQFCFVGAFFCVYLFFLQERWVFFMRQLALSELSWCCHYQQDQMGRACVSVAIPLKAVGRLHPAKPCYMEWKIISWAQ